MCVCSCHRHTRDCLPLLASVKERDVPLSGIRVVLRVGLWCCVLHGKERRLAREQGGGLALTQGPG